MLQKIMVTQSDKKRLEKLIDEVVQFSDNGDKKVKAIQSELMRATIVSDIPGNVITMNSKAMLAFGDSGTERIYSLVYPSDADMENDKLSVLAPIGTAILGLREGDTIEWSIPKGTTRITVKKVIYQPEAAGDFEL